MDTKVKKRFQNNPEIEKLILDTINELADKHNFEVFNTERMPDHIQLFISLCLNILPVN
jgi:putative transposase